MTHDVIWQVPRRRFSSRQRTSRYMGVGSSNRKNQWQARILVHGKVTHLGYYETEEDAAKVYDRVSISLHGEAAQTNFPAGQYQGQDTREYSGLDREDLQRALGVKPMDKSSKSGFLSSCSDLFFAPFLTPCTCAQILCPSWLLFVALGSVRHCLSCSALGPLC